MLILDIAFCRGKVESCSEGIVESLLCCALAAGKIEKKCSNINYCCSSSNVHKCNSTNVKTKARVMEMGATSITASCFCKQFDSYVLEGLLPRFSSWKSSDCPQRLKHIIRLKKQPTIS